MSKRMCPLILTCLTCLLILACDDDPSGPSNKIGVSITSPADGAIVQPGTMRVEGTTSGPVGTVTCSQGQESRPAIADPPIGFHCDLEVTTLGRTLISARAEAAAKRSVTDIHFVYVTDQNDLQLLFLPNPVELTLVQGRNGEARFKGFFRPGVRNVVLAVEPAVPGINVAAPANIDSGDDASVRVFLDASVSPGTYDFVIIGTEADGDATASLDVIVNVVSADAIFTLSVSGDGQGTISSLPFGIDCDAQDFQIDDCTHMYSAGTEVTLEARPAENFVSWTLCPAPDGNRCTVVMDQDRGVFAQFIFDPPGASQ